MSMTLHILKQSGRYFLIALGVIFFVSIVSFLLSWRHWQAFTIETMKGKDLLTAALSDFRAQNWSEAQIKLQGGQQAFASSTAEISALRQTWFPAKVGIGSRQLDDLQRVVDSASIISSSATQAAKLAENIDFTSFGQGRFKDLSTEKKAQILQSLIALEPELNGLKANINLAIYNLDQTHRYGILWPIRGQLAAVRDQLSAGEIILSQSIPIIRLIPAFSGYPQPVRYLIMLQNNDELRPTGGFLGSYVRLDLADFGEIKKLQADDVYHLDMPSIGKVTYTPPAPITDYLKVQNWYLRDANWSPDWPQSARFIQELFAAESAAAGQAEPPLDGVLAITPDFVAGLLRVTGPITVRGETYAAENMQALLQYNVEVAYKDDDVSSWDRKEIINELIAALNDKLMKLPLNRYPALAETLKQSLARGDMLLYFNSPGRQAVATELGGDGAIKQVTGDYVMVVDANLAAFKSDAVMSKTITYQLQEGNGLQAALNLDYRHGGGFDWRTTRYRSYTRVLAPLGSKLKAIEGLDNNETDIDSYDDEKLGKHVFGFFWSIEPGQGRKVSVKYELPSALADRLRSEKVYTLYVQRQPGSRIEKLNISLTTAAELAGTSPTDYSGKKSNTVTWLNSFEESRAIQLWTK